MKRETRNWLRNYVPPAQRKPATETVGSVRTACLCRLCGGELLTTEDGICSRCENIGSTVAAELSVRLAFAEEEAKKERPAVDDELDAARERCLAGVAKALEGGAS